MRSVTNLAVLLSRKLRHSMAPSEVILAGMDTQICKRAASALYRANSFPDPSLPSPLEEADNEMFGVPARLSWLLLVLFGRRIVQANLIAVQTTGSTVKRTKLQPLSTLASRHCPIYCLSYFEFKLERPLRKGVSTSLTQWMKSKPNTPRPQRGLEAELLSEGADCGGCLASPGWPHRKSWCPVTWPTFS